jgi:hypothetical protein
MATLALQRCLNHTGREAVARCLECGQFYCRECITEHDERVICASCLQKLVHAVEKPERPKWNFWPMLQCTIGLLLTVLIFYSAGRILIRLPDAVHEGSIMQLDFTSSGEGDNP